MAQRTQAVRHGIDSWLEYSRPWVAQRQFLVTDYNAKILSNLLAIALTLAAPRLWTLIKAALDWLHRCYRTWRSTRSNRHGREDRDAIELDGIVTRTLDATRESHSELAAVRELLDFVIQEARSGRVRLPERLVVKHGAQGVQPVPTRLQRLKHFCKALFYRPLDLLATFSFSCLLIAIFVAESAGTVLSVNIFNDNFAQHTPSDLQCTKFDTLPLMHLRPDLDPYATYQKTCYGNATEPLCESLPNRTMFYHSQVGQQCPFKNHYCVGPTFSFDTGYLPVSNLGINVLEDYTFRRKSVCSPIRVSQERSGIQRREFFQVMELDVSNWKQFSPGEDPYNVEL